MEWLCWSVGSQETVQQDCLQDKPRSKREEVEDVSEQSDGSGPIVNEERNVSKPQQAKAAQQIIFR